MKASTKNHFFPIVLLLHAESFMLKHLIHTNCLFGVFIASMLFMGCNLTNSDNNLNTNVNPEPGTFEINITGEIEKTFYGEAVYEILYGLDGTPVFWLTLRDVPTPGEDYRIINITGREMPGQGTYDIFDAEKGEPIKDEYYVSYSDSDFKGDHGGYKSTGGQLNIFSSDENQLSGSLSTSAYETVHLGDGEFQRVTVNITGEFYAEEGETGVIMN